MADHQHSAAVYFHSMGLWNKDEVINTNWKMRTLNSIKNELQHQQVRIYYCDIIELISNTNIAFCNTEQCNNAVHSINNS